MSISPIVKYVDRFIVTGFSVRTHNEDEFNKKNAKLPNLWQKLYASNLVGNANIYGVYSSYDSDANGCYTVTAGVMSTKEQAELSEAQAKLSAVTIQAGNYLIFQGRGPMPAAVVETWKRVWEFFEKNTEYRRNFISDFEAYSGSNQVDIYIGLE